MTDPQHMATGPGVPEEVGPPRRTMLLIAMPGTVSANLIRAVEIEFPSVTVEQRLEASAARMSYPDPVALILFEPYMFASLEVASADILRLHPLASAAVIEHGDREPSCRLSDLLGSRLVRGVLPMDLKLDVWLSVLRLMLHGGEYFPARLFFRQIAGEGAVPSAGVAGGSFTGAVDNDLATLTARELQILEMVARGLQNKIIAAEFSLSEHTVKVHLHNIIGKLGVQNRSEAAARFREGISARADGMFRV